MRINVAPLIHARTAYVDFRHDLLFVPQDWEDSSIQLARKFITQSTAYIELSGSNGRRVVFSDGSHIVTGITVYISELYRMCDKTPAEYAFVDGSRNNYAFIGLAVRSSEIRNAFDVPPSVFLAVYEKYIAKRWDESLSSQAWENMKIPYESINVPEVAEIADIMSMSQEITRAGASIERIAYADINTREAVTAGALSEIIGGNRKFSFCSDMPNVKSILNSDFQFVTSPNAESVLSKINGEISENPGSSTKKVPYPDESFTGANEYNPAPRRKRLGEENYVDKNDNHFFIIAAVIIGIIITATLIGFILSEKSSSVRTAKTISELLTLLIDLPA